MPSRRSIHAIEARGLALITLLQLLLIYCGNVVFVHSLAIMMSAASEAKASTRRNFIVQSSTSIGSASIASCLIQTPPVFAAETGSENSDIASLLDPKAIISWDGPSYKSARYGTSTLQSQQPSSNNPIASYKPTIYPNWFEGYHSIKYKFSGASFPQGRQILSLRTAGAGLGTCLAMPNVGYSPPSAHAVHFIQSKPPYVYEDLAYNIPRKFESFWPESKILAIQTNGGGSNNLKTNALTPKCLVTGEGCSADINPTLHLPSSRVAIDFNGPTRRGGRLIQSSDVTMLDNTYGSSTQYNDQDNGRTLYTTKTYSQYNINQDLQTFYKEISSFQRLSSNNDDVDGGIVGKIRVAAFLPYYIKEMDATTNINGGGSAGAITYNEDDAVAIYDYKVFMKSIDEIEAATM